MPVRSVAVPWRVGVCRGGLALGVRRSLVELNKLSEIGPLRIWRLLGGTSNARTFFLASHSLASILVLRIKIVAVYFETEEETKLYQVNNKNSIEVSLGGIDSGKRTQACLICQSLMVGTI